MSTSDEWKEFDAETEFKNDPQAEEEYRNIPLFDTWRRVYQPTVRFVDLEDTQNTWIEAPNELVEELEWRV